MDKRIEKSKTKIKEALFMLLQTEHLPDVSIKELCAKAEVNRNTFYSYYKTPEDVFNELTEDIFIKMSEVVNPEVLKGKTYYTFIFMVLNSVYQQREIAKAILLGNLNDSLVDALARLVHDMQIEEYMNKGFSSEEAEMAFRFSLGGAMAVIKEWARNDFKKPVPEVANLLVRLDWQSQMDAQ